MSVDETSSPVSRFAPLVKWTVRLVVIALVVWGVWRTVSGARDNLASREFSLSDVRPGWLAAAAGFYLLGMVPAWLFWVRILHAMGQRPPWRRSMKAFFIGQLGKYIPGKAMVVVLRTGLVRGPRVNAAVAAASVFVETLTMMATGALISAVIVGTLFHEHWQLMVLAIGLMLAAGLPTIPPIFRRVVGVVAKRFQSIELDGALRGLNYRLMASGWVAMTLTWILYGLSLWAVVAAIEPVAPPLSSGPLLVATVSMAMVAGFLSLLPGGVGVREAVVMTLMAPVFGELTAVVAAVLLRLVWLGTELAVSGALWPTAADRINEYSLNPDCTTRR